MGRPASSQQNATAPEQLDEMYVTVRPALHDGRAA
jgi:hypothetical protein